MLPKRIIFGETFPWDLRNGAISSVWNLSDETFSTGGDVKFKQFVHGGVLLVRRQQTNIEKVGFRWHIFVE